MSHEASAWGWSVPALPACLRVVLLALAEHVGEEGASCFPGKGRLAAMCGISERQLRNVLRELERRGLIAIEHRLVRGDERRSNVYRLAMSEGPPVSESAKATGTPTQGHRNASTGQAETGFRNCGSESPPATGTPASGNRKPNAGNRSSIADETEDRQERNQPPNLPKGDSHSGKNHLAPSPRRGRDPPTATNATDPAVPADASKTAEPPFDTGPPATAHGSGRRTYTR
jgi:hypothetical protein